jgi:hypothetical protein
VAEAAHAVIQQAKDSGLYVLDGGLDGNVESVVWPATGGSPTYPATNQVGSGFPVVDVPSREAALEWAAKSRDRSAALIRSRVPGGRGRTRARQR